MQGEGEEGEIWPVKDGKKRGEVNAIQEKNRKAQEREGEGKHQRKKGWRRKHKIMTKVSKKETG